MARQKLKQAEEESDLTSNTEKDEYKKKSRKIRAAKTVDTSMSSSDELSDDFMSEFSKIPKIPNRTVHIKKSIIATNEKGKSTINIA